MRTGSQNTYKYKEHCTTLICTGHFYYAEQKIHVVQKSQNKIYIAQILLIYYGKFKYNLLYYKCHF